MEGDEIRLDRPTIPLKLRLSIKKINKFIKDTNNKFKKIKNVSVRNGVYSGIFISIFILFFSFSIYNTIIAFIISFISVSIITSIVEFIKKTQKYTISQRLGIALGFALLLAFAAIIIILIDTQIGNPVYSISNMIQYFINDMVIKFFTTDAIRFAKSSYNSSKVVLDQIAELLKMKEEEDRKIFFGCLMKYLGVLLVIVLASFLIYKSSNDATAVNKNTIPYVLIILIPLLISIFIFSPSINMDDMPIMLLLAGGFIMMMIVLYSYFSISWNPTTLYYSSYSMNILLFIIFIVGLGICFKVFSGELKKMTGWSGFFINLLFFLPCLFNDGLQYLLNQFRITPNIVIILLFLEIVLVLLYVYIPVLINKLSQSDKSIILNRPIFLDREIPIGDSSLFLLKPIDDTVIYNSEQVYRRNYTFSMWIYLNPQSSSNNAYENGAKIFDFGGGKPSIYYKNQSKNTRIPNKDIYIISFSNTSQDAKYELHLPNQKWNNFVFNYVDSKVDLYINGSLERTFEFSDNVPEYLPTDTITIGDKNGLQGAICNVSYHTEILLPEKIMLLYNLLHMRNPPLNV
jgi:hypothetical protein